MKQPITGFVHPFSFQEVLKRFEPFELKSMSSQKGPIRIRDLGGIFAMTSPQGSGSRKTPPAKTLEGRQNQMITLAVDLAEKQLREGTASSQIVSHYLKLATVREQYEVEKIKQATELERAKTEAIEASQRSAEDYKEVLEQFQRYSGNSPLGIYDD